jgi:hypothetical protein
LIASLFLGVNQGHRIQRNQLGRFVFNNVSNAIDNCSLDILGVNQSLNPSPFSIDHLVTVSVSHGDCRLRAKGTNPKPITTQIAVIFSAIWQQLFFLSGHPLHENLIIPDCSLNPVPTMFTLFIAVSPNLH